MDPKVCHACRGPHFNDYDLCAWCSQLKQRELERRLEQNDGALSLMAIASTVVHGRQGRKLKSAWRVG